MSKTKKISLMKVVGIVESDSPMMHIVVDINSYQEYFEALVQTLTRASFENEGVKLLIESINRERNKILKDSVKIPLQASKGNIGS